MIEKDIEEIKTVNSKADRKLCLFCPEQGQ